MATQQHCTTRQGVVPVMQKLYGKDVPLLEVGTLLTFTGTFPRDVSLGLEVKKIHCNRAGAVISAVANNHRLGDIDIFVTKLGYWALGWAKGGRFTDIIPRPIEIFGLYCDDGRSQEADVRTFMRMMRGGLLGQQV